jgi:cyclophilin family peptidyl-prolyl cis-trans isomerase
LPGRSCSTARTPGHQLVALAGRPEAAVRAAAATALGKVGGDVVVPMLGLLTDGDPAVLSAAAESAAALKLPGAAALLQQRYARLIDGERRALSADGFEAAQAVHAALVALGQNAGAPPLPPAPRTFTGDVPAAPMVRFETTRGRLRVRLFPGEAPVAARNFLALTAQRSFDGLLFHRVVPGFVSQGGDPRGDGSGGPGYAIACEIGMRRYGEGALGMALSGRDTGGSQFFFTHTPQPHLDGRYTLFGEIVDGLDVASAMVEGDRILRATVE